MRGHLFALTSLVILASAAAAAHEGVRAGITVTPGQPYPGESCRIVLITSGAGAVANADRRVRLTAGMPAHLMRPVEVELERTGDPNVYTGNMTFTMAGAWRVDVQMLEDGERMQAPFEVRVLRENEVAGGTVGQYILVLQDAPEPTVLPPAYVLAGATGLTLLMEAAAIILYRRRQSAAAE